MAVDDERSSSAAPLTASPVALEALLAGLPDGVGVLGPDGVVLWANEPLVRLLGTTAEAFIGSDGYARVHPDELARAFDGILWSHQFPERTAVVPYRLLHDDGRWIDVELKSAIVPGPDGDLLVLAVRDGSPRSALAAALASVAAGRSLEDTAGWLARAITARWPFTGAAVRWVEPDGDVRVAVSHLPDALSTWLTAPPTPVAALPWGTGQPTRVAVGEDLPDELRATASRCGFTACAVAEVDDRVGGTAQLVAWFDEPVGPQLEWAHASVDLVEVLAVALDRREHLARLERAALTDALTGLANRAGFFVSLEELARRVDGSTEVIVLFVDLDRFKPVNDRLGHAVGDAVLTEIAHRLRATVRPADLVGRLGGDEFAIAAALDRSDGASAVALAERVHRALTEPISTLRGTELALGASIGIASLDDGLDRVVERADAAMYRVKATGRGGWSDGAV